MGKERSLDHSIEWIAGRYVPWIRGWFRNMRSTPEIYHFTKFEELKEDTTGAFKKVLDFYKIELSDEKIEKIIKESEGRRNMKKNIEMAKVLPRGYTSNFRSGKVGGWKEELSNAHIKKCKTLLGDALIEFGYEKDLNW
tara:strand:- start:100 stop:516 length:417 start_codon:yes stop_codon:yes gene_type:complete